MGQTKERVRFKGVVIFKHETEEDWNKSSYIPDNGETVLYDPDEIHDYPRIKVGNGIDMVKDLPFAGGSDGFIDVTELPTENINESATYRILEGTFVFNKMMRYDSTCYIVDWDSTPTEPGESVLHDNNGIFSYVGYYNVTNNTVYGYFGNETIQELKDWVDNSNLNTLEKLALKGYLSTMSAGWKTMQEIVSSVGSAISSMSWGDVITSVESIDDENALYLYLSSKAFFYKNEEWIGLNSNAKMVGTGIGAEIFNSLENSATGVASHAEGRLTHATLDSAHAEGFETTASGKMSHAEGEKTLAKGYASHAEGYDTKALEQNTHTEGCLTEASGPHAHAEGYGSKATGSASHAGGVWTEATEEAQTVIGRYNTATAGAFIIGNGTGKQINTRKNALVVDWNGNATFAGNVSAAGVNSYVIVGKRAGSTIGTNSTAEGSENIASGPHSHAEGYGVEATQGCAHAEGEGTHATNYSAHAEGYETYATGDTSHAEGYGTTASGNYSHAEGYGATASGNYSHASGYKTIAKQYQTAIGYLNTEPNDTTMSAYALTGPAFIIGSGSITLDGLGGTVEHRGNAFRVDYDGRVYSRATSGAYNSGGADYAELFEWVDLNANNEDRRGYFITLDGDKIKIAGPDDYILGIVSGCATVLGNNPEDWNGRYIRDEFGCVILEEYTYEETIIDKETGNETTVTKTGKRYKQNPDYDPKQAYIERDKRPEWAAVGMLGVLSVRDDGTCKVNGYCKVAEGGIATASESGYRVIKRVNDHVIKVVFR